MESEGNSNSSEELGANSGCFKVLVALILISICSAMFEGISSEMDDGPAKGIMFLALLLICGTIIYTIIRFNPLSEKMVAEFSGEKELTSFDIDFGPPVRLAAKINLRKLEENKDYERVELTELVAVHSSALIRNLNKCRSVDEYGTAKIDGWREELENFFKSISFSPVFITADEAINLASEQIFLLSEYDDDFVDSNDKTGFDFEQYCARKIEQTGWRARVSKRGSDQGVDIIAEKDGFVVVVQCKDYEKPVGNKAVQEALAGKSFEFADKAAVVAKNGFTKSASDLARRTGVVLLKPNDLINFTDNVLS